MEAEQVIIPILPYIILGGLMIGGLAIVGWIFTTWLRIRNGYPLDGTWGQALHPSGGGETGERVKLLTQESAHFAPSSDRSRTGSLRSSALSPTRARG